MTAKEVKDFKSIISECYKADPNVVNKWHTLAGEGLEACVEREFRDLIDARVAFFQVTDDKGLIGYFCKEIFAGQEFLTGFFLMPSFRDKENKDRFWALIQDHFGTPYFCGLFEKNIPANRFIKARGASLVGQVTLPDGLANLFKVGA